MIRVGDVTGSIGGFGLGWLRQAVLFVGAGCLLSGGLLAGKASAQSAPDRRPDTEIRYGMTTVQKDDTLRVVVEGIEAAPAAEEETFEFSWRIDEGPWLPFQPSPLIEIPAAPLRVATHRLEVRARDESNRIDPTPIQLTFTVVPVPLQERPWFWPALAGGVLLLGGLALVAVRSQRQLSRYAVRLEAEVQARTRSLHQAEARSRLALDAAEMGTWEWDVQTRDLFTSPKTRQLFGVDDGFEGTVEAYMQLIHPEDRPLIRRKVQHTLETGADYDVEFRIQRPDGSIRWLRGKGRIRTGADVTERKVYGVFVDVTERREAEERVRRSEAMLARAQRIVHLGSWELDVPRNILTWSDEVYRIFGTGPQSFGATYEAFLAYIHPEDRDRMQQAQEAALREERPLDITHRIIRADGAVRVVREQGEVEQDAAGQPQRLTGTVQDITERHELEQDLMRRNRELNVLLEVSNRLTLSLSLDEMLDDLAATACDLVPAAEAATLWLYDAGRDAVVLRAQEGHNGLANETLRFDADASLFGRVRAEDGPVLVADSLGAREWTALGQASLDAVRATLGVPMRVRGRLIGLLFVDSFSQRDAFDERDAALMQTLGAQGAVGIHTNRLYTRLQALARRLVQAQETERSRLARELHDEVGGTLTALKLSLQMLAAREDRALPALDEAMDMVSQLMDQVRHVSMMLRPTALDEFGLVQALHGLAERYTKKTHIQVDLRAPSLDDVDLSPEVQTVAYRIVQEALTNVARYAEVDRAAVTLKRQEEHIEVEVVDEGVGFDPDAVSEETLGLSGMRERAALVSGTFEIEAALGAGTQVRAVLPIEAGRPSHAVMDKLA